MNRSNAPLSFSASFLSPGARLQPDPTRQEISLGQRVRSQNHRLILHDVKLSEANPTRKLDEYVSRTNRNH